MKEFPELTIGGPTAAWVYASCRTMEEVDDIDFCKQIKIPTLLISAGNDVIVSNKSIENFSRKLRSGKTLTINGAKHELLQERDIFREQLLAAFDSFIPGS
jgi:lysophospholipase